jgi:SAM-dependent methyltransferase
LRPAKFARFYALYHDKTVVILDVGCGDNSPSLTKRYFPRCVYHGLDRIDYNIDESDREAIDKLYRLDLDVDSLDVIPDATYDLVIMSHVIEHLKKPEVVAAQLCRKLKPGGHLYLEFPSLRSLSLPSMEGTMQFCDDPTHIYLPDPYVLTNVLLRNGVKVLHGGVRRDKIRFAMSPLFRARNIVRRILGKRRQSKGLCDATGFAFQLFGEKKRS